MPVMMIMQWAGVTREQYEAIRQVSNFAGDPARGGLFHIAALTDAGLQVTDLWERAEDFEAFIQSRVTPAVQKMGIQRQPKISLACPGLCAHCGEPGFVGRPPRPQHIVQRAFAQDTGAGREFGVSGRPFGGFFGADAFDDPLGLLHLANPLRRTCAASAIL